MTESGVITLMTRKIKEGLDRFLPDQQDAISADRGQDRRNSSRASETEADQSATSFARWREIKAHLDLAED